MNQLVKEKLKKIRQESPCLHIGKKGITPLLMKELKDRIKQNKMIKLKILKNSPYKSRSEAFEDLKNSVPRNGKIMEIRGWTAVLRKR